MQDYKLQYKNLSLNNKQLINFLAKQICIIVIFEISDKIELDFKLIKNYFYS